MPLSPLYRPLSSAGFLQGQRLAVLLYGNQTLAPKEAVDDPGLRFADHCDLTLARSTIEAVLAVSSEKP